MDYNRPTEEGCVGTVEPRLSESPLSEPSVFQKLFLILKYQKQFDFLQNEVINEKSVWFLNLLGLLYHSAVGIKAN